MKCGSTQILCPSEIFLATSDHHRLYRSDSVTLKIDPVAFAKTLTNSGDPNALINDSLAILYRVPLSDASKQTIKKQILLTNQEQDYYWTNAWTAHITQSDQ